MEDLVVAPTKYSPLVNFSGRTGILELSGLSYPENSFEFYKPVMDWIQDYKAQKDEKWILNFKLAYFNTSSSKCLLKILEILEDKYSKGHDIEIRWFYQDGDDDIFETGKELFEEGKIPYSLVKY